MNNNNKPNYVLLNNNKPATHFVEVRAMDNTTNQIISKEFNIISNCVPIEFVVESLISTERILFCHTIAIFKIRSK